MLYAMRFPIVGLSQSAKNKPQHVVARKITLQMIKYENYEKIFKRFDISSEEANVLIGYMEALAEIGIKVINETK